MIGPAVEDYLANNVAEEVITMYGLRPVPMPEMPILLLPLILLAVLILARKKA